MFAISAFPVVAVSRIGIVSKTNTKIKSLNVPTVRTLATMSSWCQAKDYNAYHIREQGHNTNLAGRRYMSSRSKDSHRRFKLDALPFSIAPEQALEKFRKWAEDDQGLKYLMDYNSIRIGAAYVPVWSFDLNVRFAPNSDWKPPMFAVYRGQSTVYIPGLSAYSGYSYRRSLIQPVHATSLVFLGNQTEPFGGWMLRDMVLQSTKAPISVTPDAWNATQGRALHVLKEELQAIVDVSWSSDSNNSNKPTPKVQTQVVRSRRVYMPTFVVEYKILGLEYMAFISGCDQGAPVGGSSHSIMGDGSILDATGLQQSSFQFLSGMFRVDRLPFILRLLRPAASLLWFVVLRLWSALPVIGLAGGAVAGYRKIYQPWMDAKTATAEWERQREHESLMEEESDADFGMRNDFRDPTGDAQRYFTRNRTQILNFLSGEQEHEQGGYDWYKEWQTWAQQQWEQQARQQQQQQQQWQQTWQQHSRQQQSYQQQQQSYQRQQQQQQQRQSKKTEFHWDFDPNDPYSVLGISRGATKEQVSKAFRTEMLKHHPDTQPNATDAQKTRLSERSKLITEAYRKIKTEMKQR